MKYEFKMEPWDHQRKALTESWDKEYWALLLEYGCGKTKVILDTVGINFEITKKIEALFVIAPNNVHAQWIDEQIPEHLPDRIEHIDRIWTGSTSKKYKKSLEDFWLPKNENKLKIFSLNVEALQSSERARNMAVHFLQSFQTLLAIDESTRIKTPGAKRAKFVVNRLSKLATMRRTLTGNEVTRSPFDVYMPYKFLKEDFWAPLPNSHIFQHRYGEYKKRVFFKKDIKVKDWSCPECKKSPDKINFKRMSGRAFATCNICNKVIQPDRLPANAKKITKAGGKNEFSQVVGYKNLDELRAKTVSCSTLVRKKDCMDLPPLMSVPVITKMNSEQTRIYKELKNELFTIYKDEELVVENKVALMVRFQQIVGGFFPETEEQIGDTNPKMDALVYDLEDIDDPSPIIVWARFTAEIRGIAIRLKKEYPKKVVETFYGETKKGDRKDAIARFKAGKIDYFVANPAVAGTGLNLQRSHISYYYSNSFNFEDRDQSESRIHRGGQEFPCLLKDIFIPGTIDDTVKKANKTKQDLANFFKEDRIEDLV